MSGFSPEWLALREPADLLARSPALLRELAARVAGRTIVSFTDLGCGTGSNLRATALAFPPAQPQRWRLFDHDAALLNSAREALCAWADTWNGAGVELMLEKAGRKIAVTFHDADLSRDFESLIEPGDILTASAFFDLVSQSWMTRFAGAAARAKAPVYTVLTYNGVETWLPPHPAGGPMLAAFHIHQRGDKGFGPAAGPHAAKLLSDALELRGYAVESRDSSWRLGDGERRLIEELATGSAAAVRELNLFDVEAAEAWLESRRHAASCLIGHTDILAWPP